MVRMLLCGGSSATSGTCELYGADDGVLGVDELEVVIVEVADLQSLAQTEVVNIDDNALGDLGVDSLNLELLHREGELTASLNAFGVAFNLDWYLDDDGLGVVDLKQVDVEESILYGLELQVLDDSHALYAVKLKLDGEHVGSIDELADSLGAYSEVGGDDALAVFDGYNFLAFEELAVVGKFYDFAAVEDYGNQARCAQPLGGLLAESRARLSMQLECFHFVENKCVTKN